MRSYADSMSRSTRRPATLLAFWMTAVVLFALCAATARADVTTGELTSVRYGPNIILAGSDAQVRRLRYWLDEIHRVPKGRETLRFSAVENLYHELAHAMHKMLGTWNYARSEMQAIAEENEFRVQYARMHGEPERQRFGRWADAVCLLRGTYADAAWGQDLLCDMPARDVAKVGDARG